MNRRAGSDAEHDLPGIVLVEVKVGRARHRSNVDDHRIQEARDRLRNGCFVTVGCDLHLQSHHVGDLTGPWTRGVSDHLRVVGGLVGSDAADAAILHEYLYHPLAKAELGSQPLGLRVEGVDG